MTDSIQLFILIAFATLILLLAQSRELMRQIARTAEEWHRLRDAVQGPRRMPYTGSRDVVDVKQIADDLDED